MYYRVLRQLGRNDKTIKVGCLTSLDWLLPADIERLEKAGAVSEIHGPPLSEIPGWTRRAVRLRLMGIGQAEDFLLAEDEAVTKEMRIKKSTVLRWKAELLEWLVVSCESRR